VEQSARAIQTRLVSDLIDQVRPEPGSGQPDISRPPPASAGRLDQGDNDLANLLVAFHEPMRINDLVKGQTFCR
jgi:hypothetical protein